MAAKKIYFPESKDVTIIKTLTGEETMGDMKVAIESYRNVGQSVVWNTSLIDVPQRLYLCTVFVDAGEMTIRVADIVSGRMYIGPYLEEETIRQVLEKAVDAYVSITVSAETQDGVTVAGQTVYIHNGADASAPVSQSKPYDGKPIVFLLGKGMQYFVRITDDLSGHFSPTTATGYANASTSVTLVYSDVSNVTRLEDIAPALKAIGSVEIAKNTLVGKVFEDVWVDYDAIGNGDATPANVENHPAWLDPLVITNVEEVEDVDGVKHIGAVLMRKYCGRYDIVFDAPNTELATEETAQDGIYYYGLEIGQTSPTAAKLTLLTLSAGAEIPYSSYEKIYRNSVRDNSKNIIQYGHNRYETSAFRQYLNSAAPNGEWWHQQHVGQKAPTSNANYSGYKRGCSSALLSCIKPVKRPVFSNTAGDGGATYYVCDDIFLPSCTEMFGTSNPNEGDYQYRYWQGIAGPDAQPADSATALNTARKMIRINNKASTSASVVRLRSAYRSNSYNVWYVYTSGILNSYIASSAYAAAPACVIY